jgi:precorrin-3B synthase
VRMPAALDACPGVLTLHAARDGHVARIRLPGGYVSRAQWTALTALAGEFGDGCLDLTARGNVQLRGLAPAAADGLARGAARAGLLPSGAHDRSRNVTASPLAGLGGRPPLRRLVRALDAAIVADPVLAALPGRFLFAADDGTGGAGLAGCDVGVRRDGRPADVVTGRPADVVSGRRARILAGRQAEIVAAGRAARAAGRQAEIVVAGRLTGVRVPVSAAVPAVVTAARAAVTGGVGSVVTRIADLPDGGAAAAAAIGGTLGPPATAREARLSLGQRDESGPAVLVVAAPLGRLDGRQAALLGRLLRPGEALRLATAGRVVVPLADALAALPGSGLLVSDEEDMAGVTACSGMACRQALADVRAAARPLPGHGPLHWAACSRGCGRPPDAELVVATGPDSFALSCGCGFAAHLSAAKPHSSAGPAATRPECRPGGVS